MIAQEINKLADKFAGMGVHDDYDPWILLTWPMDQQYLQMEMGMNMSAMLLEV